MLVPGIQRNNGREGEEWGVVGCMCPKEILLLPSRIGKRDNRNIQIGFEFKLKNQEERDR